MQTQHKADAKLHANSTGGVDLCMNRWLLANPDPVIGSWHTVALLKHTPLLCIIGSSKVMITNLDSCTLINKMRWSFSA